MYLFVCVFVCVYIYIYIYIYYSIVSNPNVLYEHYNNSYQNKNINLKNKATAKLIKYQNYPSVRDKHLVGI